MNCIYEWFLEDLLYFLTKYGNIAIQTIIPYSPAALSVFKITSQCKIDELLGRCLDAFIKSRDNDFSCYK